VLHEDFKDIILKRAEKILYYIDRYHHFRSAWVDIFVVQRSRDIC